MIFLGLARRGCDAVGDLVHRHYGWRYGVARTDPLQTVYDNALTALQAAFDNTQTILVGTYMNFAVIGMVVFADHEYEALVLVGADGFFVDQQRLTRGSATESDTGIQSWQQLAVGVVKNRAHTDGAGGAVETVVVRANLALARISIFVGQAEINRHLFTLAAGRVDVLQEALFVHIKGGIDLGHRYQCRQWRCVGAD